MDARPTLLENGDVRFSDAQALCADVTLIAAKGGIVVDAASPPTVLTRLEATLVAGAIKVGPLACQIIVVQGKRAVLQFDDHSRDTARVHLMLESQAASPMRGVPVVDRGILHFANWDMLAKFDGMLRNQGFVLAHPAPGATSVDAVKLAVGKIVDAVRIEATVLPHQHGNVAMQFRRIDDIAQALNRLALRHDDTASPLDDTAPPLDDTAPPLDDTAPPRDAHVNAGVPTSNPTVDDDIAPSDSTVDDDIARILRGYISDAAPDVEDAPLAAPVDEDIPLAATVDEDAPLAAAVDEDVPLAAPIETDDARDEEPAPKAASSQKSIADVAPTPVGLQASDAPSTTWNDDEGDEMLPPPRASAHLLPTVGLRSDEGPPVNALDDVAAPQEVPSQEVASQEVTSQEATSQEVASQEAPSQETPSQEVASQEAPSQEASAQEASAQEASAQEASAQEAPAVRAPPPSYENNTLTFVNGLHLFASENDVNTVGAIHASGKMKGAGGARKVKIIVDREPVGDVDAILAPMGPSDVVVQLVDAAQFKTLKDRVCAPVNEVDDDGHNNDDDALGDKPTATGVLTVAAAGDFKNPRTPSEFLSLAMVRLPTALELHTPSIPVLMRILLARRETVVVHFTIGKHTHKFALLKGGSARGSGSTFSTLARSLAASSGTYELLGEEAVASIKTKGSTKDLLTEILRALVAIHDYDALEAAFADRADQLVNLTSAGERALAGLALTGTQTRLIKSWFTGKYTVGEIAASPSGARAAWETIYLLAILDGLEFLTPSASSPKEKALSPLQVLWADIEGKNHFDVLGVHWSLPPRKLDAVYRERSQRFGPASAFGQKEPALAKTIQAAFDEAIRVLSSTESRQNYRRETFALKWSQQAELMTNHAKLAIYRSEFEDARDTLDGVLDFFPTDEAKKLLKQLLDARRGSTGG